MQWVGRHCRRETKGPWGSAPCAERLHGSSLYARRPPTAWGQAVISDEVRAGHHLAAMLCDECHIATLDQALPPRRDPPAPSFESIAQRKDINADSLEHFLRTTHEGLDNPKGMENPNSADFQVKAIVAYILSLRK